MNARGDELYAVIHFKSDWFYTMLKIFISLNCTDRNPILVLNVLSLLHIESKLNTQTSVVSAILKSNIFAAGLNNQQIRQLTIL